jgi:hypothetical protein
MASPAQSVALLLMEHVREPFVGPVLVYGKQAMNVGFEGMLKMFQAVGLQPDPAGLDDPPPAGEYIDFARLIKLMGLGELRTLDVSAYEGAEIIADLNLPVPAELRGRFGWIVDGGTMEHVFDIRQGMKNTADMLRAGGRAVHLSPTNNYVNHGFVQLSPAFYHDYYVANGFDDVRGILVVQPRADILGVPWNLFEYEHATMGGMNAMLCSEGTQLAVYFSARKNAGSTSDRVPVQSPPTRAEQPPSAAYQFLITHDAAKLNLESLVEPAPQGRVPIHELVHIGFGDRSRS